MARTLFGDCTLDTDGRVLLRAGRPVHLTPKAFNLLEMLLAKRPRAVAKSELMSALWPGVVVTEGSLANLVSEIRLATADTARPPRFIRTVHRFGYAFCGEACREETSEEAPREMGGRFRLVTADGEVELAEGTNLVGRAGDCRLRIWSPTVSRHHARVLVRGEEVWVEDLGSTNGTLVGGRAIGEPRQLRVGEEIRLGAVRVRLAVSPRTSTDTFSMGIKPVPRPPRAGAGRSPASGADRQKKAG